MGNELIIIRAFYQTSDASHLILRILFALLGFGWHFNMTVHY